MTIRLILARLAWCCMLFSASAAAQETAGGPQAQATEAAPIAGADAAKAPPCSKPEYPRLSLRNAEEGTVHLSFLVNTDGVVVDSKVVKSTGFVRLDEEARMTIAKCRFKPGQKNGKPIEAWVRVVYVWALE